MTTTPAQAVRVRGLTYTANADGEHTYRLVNSHGLYAGTIRAHHSILLTVDTPGRWTPADERSLQVQLGI